MSASVAFWNRAARRYAARPMRKPEFYEQTLARVSAYLEPTDTVVEIGAGTSTTALRLAPHVASYTATDYAQEMVEIGREKLADSSQTNLRILRAEPTNLPAELAHLNAVLAFNVLHLSTDLAGDLACLHNRLAPGGLLISKTPCLSGKYRLLWPIVTGMRLLGKAPIFRFISPRQLERRIEAAGFTLVECDDLPRPSRFIVARKT